MFDFLIVGAGFAGSVVAEQMARVSRKESSGCRPPQPYRWQCLRSSATNTAFWFTNTARISSIRILSRSFRSILSQFTEWRPYEHRVLASVDGKLVPIPINLEYRESPLRSESYVEQELEAFFAVARRTERQRFAPRKMSLSARSGATCTRSCSGTTRASNGAWILPSSTPQVTARIPVRTNRDDRYFTDTYQAMPLHGFTRMFENMLDHPNINVCSVRDYRDVSRKTSASDEIDVFRSGR